MSDYSCKVTDFTSNLQINSLTKNFYSLLSINGLRGCFKEKSFNSLTKSHIEILKH